MQDIKNVINILKDTPEPFSVDGIIKSFEASCIKFLLIHNMAIYFDKEANCKPALWYRSLGFRSPHGMVETAREVLKVRESIESPDFISFPLSARGIYFGVIILNQGSNFKTETFVVLVDYLAMLLYSEKLSFLANRDKLTTLYNRGYILRLLGKWEERKMLYSIIIIDLDRFKHYNDRYGHAVGDLILKLASKAMKNALSNIECSATLARYGGEEFIVALQTTEREQLLKTMELIRINISESDFSNNEYLLKATASLGGAIKTDEMNLDTLIDNADKSLYNAKHKGRNMSVIN